MLAGVCGGLAQYLNVDVVVVRLGWIMLALMGPGIVGYPVAWLLIPLSPEGELAAQPAGCLVVGAAGVLLVALWHWLAVVPAWVPVPGLQLFAVIVFLLLLIFVLARPR